MALGNTCESDVLKLLFQNVSWANVGNAGGLLQSTVAGSFYISLHTASAGAAGNQTTNETAYTNYARQGVARSAGGWTISGSAPTQSANAAAITFPACGVTGATITDVVVGRDSSSTGENTWFGTLTSSLAVSNGITPSFAIGALVCTLS